MPMGRRGRKGRKGRKATRGGKGGKGGKGQNGQPADGDGREVLLRPSGPVPILHVPANRPRLRPLAGECVARPVSPRGVREEDRDEAVVFLEGSGRVVVDDGEGQFTVDASNVESGIQHLSEHVLDAIEQVAILLLLGVRTRLELLLGQGLRKLREDLPLLL